MGANQNSSRNLAYIPKSTQIHNTQNLVVLKPRLAVEHGAKPKRTNEESDSEKMAAAKLKHEPKFCSSGKRGRPQQPRCGSGDETRGRSVTSELKAKTEKARKDWTCR
jgi:hypothetical protein